ncbi:MAG: hypothetical protein V1661_01690 [bacterium]
MEEKTKKSFDDVWKAIKKSFVPAGILSSIFIYGPERCAALLKNVLNWTSEKITDTIEQMLIIALDVSAGLRPILSGWIRQLARIGRKWLVRSIVVALVYLALLTLGVAFKAGPFIAIVGIITGLYFYVVSFVIEKSILAAGAVFSTGKTTAELLAKIPKAVLEKIGLELGDSSKEAASSSAFRDKLKDVRFLGVPFTAIAFWLAFFPSWRFYGFLFPFLAGVLSLLLVSIWKEWSSRVWYYYHKATKLALVAMIVCFTAKNVLPEEALNGFGRFAKNEVMAIVDWLNASKTVPPQAAKTKLTVVANIAPVVKSNPPFGRELMVERPHYSRKARIAVPKKLPEPQESEADAEEDADEAEAEEIEALANESLKILERVGDGLNFPPAQK